MPVKLNSISLQEIGRIRTPFMVGAGTPIQPAYANGAEGQVLLDERFQMALDDLTGFERIWLIYWLDRASSFSPHVVPYRDTQARGLFATRAPSRPNPIGLSVVRLLERSDNCLRVADVDMLDNTPLLDIKPYVPEFDSHPLAKAGWLECAACDRRQADERFHKPDTLHPENSAWLERKNE